MSFPGLEHSAVGPDSPLLRSQRYLASAYDSVASLIDITYPAVRALRQGSRGRLTHAEHDIFRAAVVFAGAGVDTVVKEAMRGCVAIQIQRSDGAKDKYIEFVTRFIQDGSSLSAKQLALLLASPSSDEVLVRRYVESLTGSSLQSINQLTIALSALGLQTEKDLYKGAGTLSPLFKARNEIAHELDMTPASAAGRGARHRRERSITAYTDMCHGSLNFSQQLLNRLEAAMS